MKKWFVVAVVLAAAGAAAIPILQRSQNAWDYTAPHSGQLVLAVNGTSPQMAATRLEIRCGGEVAQVRLHVPVQLAPPVGPGGAAAKLRTVILEVSEEFLDADRKVIRASENGLFAWTVSDDGGFAERTDPRPFIEALNGPAWLNLHVLGVAGGGALGSASLYFPLAGLVKYRDKIAESCGAAAG